MTLKWMKRHRPLMAPLVIFLYLILGATVPFHHHKPVSRIAKENTLAVDSYQDGPGCDQAMIPEANQSAWDERMRLMGMAKERIVLSIFDFRDGESPRDIMSLVLHEADEGIKIQILVDGSSGLVRIERNNYFYVPSNHPSIEIKIYDKINLLQPRTTRDRTHDKYVIADNYGYVLGGRDIFDHFIGPYPTNSHSHDRGVLMHNTAHGTEDSAKSSLYQVEEYFNQVWSLRVSSLLHDNETLGEKISVKNAAAALRGRYDSLASAYPELFALDNEDNLAIPEGLDPLTYHQTHTVPVGKITLVSNLITIYAEEPVIFYTLAQLMRQAEEYVVIYTPYTVLSNTVYETISKVTKQVPTAMIVNSVENGDNSLVSSDYPLHKKKLINTSMGIPEHDGELSYRGRSPVIDDGLCAISSYNFGLCSIYMDAELIPVIQSPSLTIQLKEHMDSYQQDCRILQSDGIYKVPARANVASVSPHKRVAWKAVGFII